MKILYLFAAASAGGSSVQTKIIEQVKALNRKYVSCKAIFFSTDEVNENSEMIRWIKVPKVEEKWFRSSKQRTAYQETVLEFLEARDEKYDFIYYRYPGAHKVLLKQTEKFGHKIFFEHVTAETFEIQLYSRENPPAFNLSSLLSYYEFCIAPLRREKKYGCQIRQNVLFGICNSDDIAIYERRMADYNYKTLVLGDAVNVSLYPLRSMPDLNTEFRILFLKGASGAAEFNGIDRVLKGMAAYKGSYKIKLYLHGKNLQSETALVKELGIEEMVISGPYIGNSEINELMNKVHFGISALAVHRKGIKGTTTIKTREYFARGLPFVFGHQDPDFSQNYSALQYCMEVPGTDEALDFEAIINWYLLHIDKKENICTEMRNFAESKLDYQVKMGNLAFHLNEVSILGK